MQRRHLLGYGAAGVGALGLMLGVGWWRVDGPGAPQPAGQRPLPLSAMDFRLTDHEGNEVGPDTLIGRPTMVFFGFTYCPDVCPTTLSDISGWLEDLGDGAAQMNVVFITVDPERDTVEALDQYHDHFDPRFAMLTGSPEQVKQAAQAYRVYYAKAETDTTSDYLMDHSSFTYLMAPDGSFVTHFVYNTTAEQMATQLREIVGG